MVLIKLYLWKYSNITIMDKTRLRCFYLCILDVWFIPEIVATLKTVNKFFRMESRRKTITSTNVATRSRCVESWVSMEDSIVWASSWYGFLSYHKPFHQVSLNEATVVVLQRYFRTLTWTGTLSVIFPLDLLFSESLQANSKEPSIGRKPNVTHATDSIISIL